MLKTRVPSLLQVIVYGYCVRICVSRTLVRAGVAIALRHCSGCCGQINSKHTGEEEKGKKKPHMAKTFIIVKATIKSDNKVVLDTPNVAGVLTSTCALVNSQLNQNLVTRIHDQELDVLQEDLAGETRFL